MKINKKGKSRKRNRGDLLLYTVVVTYFAIQYAVFYLYIHLNSLLLLFQRYSPDAVGNYVWVQPLFANFQRFFQEFFMDSNKLLYQALLRGPLTYILSFAIGFIPSIIGPYYIHKKMPMGRIFKVMFFLPGIVGAAVLVIMYTNIVEVFVPALTKALFKVQVEGLFANPDTVFATMMLYGLWLGAGAGNLLYIGTLNTMPDSLSEAMQIDGAGHIKEIIYLAFPTIYPVFSIGIWMGIPALFTGTLPTYVFFGTSANSNLYTLSYYITKLTLHGGDIEYPYISTINVMICILSLPLIFISRHLLEKFGPSAD